MNVEIQNLDDEFYHPVPNPKLQKRVHHRGTEDSKVGMDLSFASG
jgi:hypothetical protein